MLGDIVLYRLTRYDAECINRRRASRPQDAPLGVQRHLGNPVVEGDQVPMIVVRDASCVNGQVLLDGSDSLWVTSVYEGTDLGQWSRRE